LINIVGVGKQTGTDHQVSQPDQKPLKTYESFFWLTSNEVLETEQAARHTLREFPQ
jgi:hypothetical protein